MVRIVLKNGKNFVGQSDILGDCKTGNKYFVKKQGLTQHRLCLRTRKHISKDCRLPLSALFCLRNVLNNILSIYNPNKSSSFHAVGLIKLSRVRVQIA